MTSVSAETNAAKKRVGLMQGTYYFPGFVLGTVVYKHDAALRRNKPFFNEIAHFGLKLFGGKGKSLFLVITGHDNI